MAKQPIDFRPSNDLGNDDAGDASAALYRNEDTMSEGDGPGASSLQPGEDVSDLRAAAHGDPDLDLDETDEDAADEQDEPLK